MTRIKRILSILISVLPINVLRTSAYSAVLKYKINGAKIGWGTVICVKHAEISNCNIGKFNRFSGPITVIIKKNANIGSSNRFQCGDWTTKNVFQDKNFERYLELGENTLITGNHYFDVAGSFVLGKNSWIAGWGSQFWTHGAGIIDRNIRIGEYCYIGSAVRFSPGSRIGNKVLVGIGSVVTKKIDRDYVMLGGAPAVVIKEDYDWKTKENIGNGTKKK